MQIEVGQITPDRSASSAPIRCRCRTAVGASPDRQRVPQYRSRDSAQSTLFSSQLPKRPCLMFGGCQLMRSFSRNSGSRCSDVRTNQEVLAQ
jgi:hypothetical protein